MSFFFFLLKAEILIKIFSPIDYRPLKDPQDPESNLLASLSPPTLRLPSLLPLLPLLSRNADPPLLNALLSAVLQVRPEKKDVKPNLLGFQVQQQRPLAETAGTGSLTAGAATLVLSGALSDILHRVVSLGSFSTTADQPRLRMSQD